MISFVDDTVQETRREVTAVLVHLKKRLRVRNRLLKLDASSEHGGITGATSYHPRFCFVT
jgi:hypothetical protein